METERWPERQCKWTHILECIRSVCASAVRAFVPRATKTADAPRYATKEYKDPSQCARETTTADHIKWQSLNKANLFPVCYSLITLLPWPRSVRVTIRRLPCRCCSSHFCKQKINSFCDRSPTLSDADFPDFYVAWAFCSHNSIGIYIIRVLVGFKIYEFSLINVCVTHGDGPDP